MIRDCNSLAVAKVVVDLVKNLSVHEELDGYVECFQNCREQGLIMFAGDYPNQKYCIVTENRNSDNIRVYYGFRNADLDGLSNMPNNDKWEQCKFFSYNEHFKAAEFVINYLKGE